MPADATLRAADRRPVPPAALTGSPGRRAQLFDGDSPDADPLDERDDHRGVDRMARVARPRPALRARPDLVGGPGSHRPAATARPASGCFDPRGRAAPTGCTADRRPPPAAGRPRSDELAEIIRRRRLVDVAASARFVALLDAPSGLSVASSRAGGPASTPATPPPTTPGSACPATSPDGARCRCRRPRSPPGSSRPGNGGSACPGARRTSSRSTWSSPPTTSPTPCTTSCTCRASTYSAPSGTGSG